MDDFMLDEIIMDNLLDEIMDDGLDLLGEMLMNGLDEMMDGRLMDLDDNGLDPMG